MLCFSLLRGPAVLSYSTKVPWGVLAEELVTRMQEMKHAGFKKDAEEERGNFEKVLSELACNHLQCIRRNVSDPLKRQIL